MGILNIKNIQGRYSTINEIKKSEKEGTLHLLYEYYINMYGSKNYSHNLLVPFFINNKEHEVYIINNPKDAERLANTHIKKMPNLKTYLFDSIISTTDNDNWKNQRRNLVPAFSVADELVNIIPISVKRAVYCSKLLWEISDEGDDEININDFFLNEAMAQLQLGMFGLSDDFEKSTNAKIRNAFNTFNTKYGKKYGLNLLKNIKKAKGPLSIALNDLNKETSSKTEPFGNGIIFTFAGHDTTGHTLTWLIYELCKNDKYKTELYEEVDNFWKEQGNKEIEYDDLKRLSFMTKCIFETLRLWPAIPNGTFRELTKDDYITGTNNEKIKLKKGSYVQISNWLRHRNSKLWGDDVNTFNPYRDFEEDENWNGSSLASYNPNSERFSPFTYGPRDCIGKNFSQIEMRIILIHLLKDYDFYLSDIHNSNDLYKLTINGFTMGPRNPYNEKMSDKTMGLYVYVNKRRKSKL
uniref:Cytochrome P450 n=1 Tax=Megaviridae environmental sample TaxID=1737588 RepID=A0A5J6VLH1_9VIRU|nr:MAG: cytochrome P450 [Megaviridae environmental sample]